jgi:hypothetical protein
MRSGAPSKRFQAKWSRVRVKKTRKNKKLSLIGETLLLKGASTGLAEAIP